MAARESVANETMNDTRITVTAKIVRFQSEVVYFSVCIATNAGNIIHHCRIEGKSYTVPCRDHYSPRYAALLQQERCRCLLCSQFHTIMFSERVYGSKQGDPSLQSSLGMFVLVCMPI